jgi:hypothetical protein
MYVSTQGLVIFKHSVPIGRRVQNYKRFLSGFSVEELIQFSQQPCKCHRYVHLPHNGSAYCPEGHEGHVLTADPHFAQIALPPAYGPAVVELLSLGAKYRPTGVTVMTPEHRASTMESFTAALHTYIVALQQDAKSPADHFIPFRTEVLRAFSQRLANVPDDVPLAPPEALECSDHARYGFYLLGLDYVITYCEKATANLAVICKAWAAAKLLKELNIVGQQGNPNYTPAIDVYADPPRHIAFFMAESQTTLNIPVPPAHRQLLYFACIPKFPKKPCRSPLASRR